LTKGVVPIECFAPGSFGLNPYVCSIANQSSGEKINCASVVPLLFKDEPNSDERRCGRGRTPEDIFKTGLSLRVILWRSIMDKGRC
jgi:hypothetical protein